MDKELLEYLGGITPEEKEILSGRNSVDRALYSDRRDFVIDSHKILDTGKLIEIRPNTRFVHFPVHTHNYVEMVYMCSGHTEHVINGSEIELKSGEILILNQHARQEIKPAGRDDIAVNFIIMPEFFDRTLNMLGNRDNMLRDFLIGCLSSDDSPVSYLHFRIADILPIQNLTENLVWTIIHGSSDDDDIKRNTMGLLFLQLLNYTDKIDYNSESYEHETVMNVLQYIKNNYRRAELKEIAEILNCEFTWLSKTVRKLTGLTYTELLQQERIARACELLRDTSLTVDDISVAVGYENVSYFHRLFRKFYGTSPRQYRLNH